MSQDPQIGEIQIRPVEGRRGHAEFFAVKRLICSQHSAAVLPMRFMEWAQLNDQTHPFYKHARRKMFVAYLNGRPVGRIAAIQDHMHNEYYQDQLGTFGFFECIENQDVANLLLKTAEDQLRSWGCNQIRGPLNPSMKGEFGVLVEGNDWPPFLMIAWTPRYYDVLLQKAGFVVCKRFYAFLLDTVKKHDEMENNYAHLQQVSAKILGRFPNIKVSRATKENVLDLVREINVIGNRVRSDGYGFVPNTDEELDFMVSQIKRIIDPRIVIVAHVDGRLAAYNVCVPNINWALKRSKGRWDWLRLPQFLYWMRRIPEVRLIAVGVDPKSAAKGLSALVTEQMVAMHANFTYWEFSWIAEDNLPSMSAMFRGAAAEKYKVIQLYEKPIAN
ncbi:MAG: hypothetical protein R3C03_12550 [Pirellulaceae bacterium]